MTDFRGIRLFTILWMNRAMFVFLTRRLNHMFPSRLEYRLVLTFLKISANDGPSTVLRQAITAALSSLACKI